VRNVEGLSFGGMPRFGISDSFRIARFHATLLVVSMTYRGLVILSYTIRVAVNFEGDYGKSRERASGASY
jgi:hypothetical protein